MYVQRRRPASSRRSARVRGLARELVNKGIALKHGQQGLFQPVRPLSDLLEDLECPFGDDTLALMLVEPLARLLFEGVLTDLMLLARWEGSLSFWGGFPGRAWAAARRGQMYVPAPVALTASHFRDLCTDLRRWSPRIINSGVDDGGGDQDEGPGDDAQLLERHLLALDGFVEEMDPPLKPMTVRKSKNNRKHPARQLLSIVLASQLLKNPANMGTLIKDKLVHLLPTSLRSLFSEAFAHNVVDLPVWDHRLLLLVDVATMYHRRQRISLEPGRGKYMSMLPSPTRTPTPAVLSSVL